MINYTFGVGVPFVGQDISARRCAGCGNAYRGRGAGGGMCSDRCWMASRGRQVSQGATLGRAFGAAVERGQRQRIGRARVDVLLADAALQNRVERYQQDRAETLALISRTSRTASSARSISRSAAAMLAHCDECSGMIARGEATPEECAQICGGSAYRAQPSDWLPCRGCGVPVDRCTCGGLAVR